MSSNHRWIFPHPSSWNWTCKLLSLFLPQVSLRDATVPSGRHSFTRRRHCSVGFLSQCFPSSSFLILSGHISDFFLSLTAHSWNWGLSPQTLFVWIPDSSFMWHGWGTYSHGWFLSWVYPDCLFCFGLLLFGCFPVCFFTFLFLFVCLIEIEL